MRCYNDFDMQRILVLSLGNFFAAGQFFLVLYIIAPYLAMSVPAAMSGLAISLGAVITLSLFPSLPRFVHRYGPQKLAVAFGTLELVMLLGLAAYPGPVLAVLLVAFACATAPFIAYQLDLLLEGTVEDETQTGRVRTLFLTAANIALVLSPIATGYLLADSERYGLVFLVAAACLLPFIGIMAFARFAQTAPPETQHDLLDASRCLMGDRDLCAVAVSHGVLQFFFHIVPLYIPLYLHTVLGFPWSDLGWMFAVMLIPFVVLEYPVGWLADTRFGDRRIMAAGFVIAGLSLAAIGFITAETPLGPILAILILTRIGGALVEATTEGHFFRRVGAYDTQSVSLFRMLRPLGALTAPVIATLLLLTGNYLFFFAVTGFAVFLAGFVAALTIQDTRPVAHTSPYAAPPFPPQGAPKAHA